MNQPTHRAVILAAGRGTRMRAPAGDARLDATQRTWAERGVKGLIPFHGHAYLSYVMSALADGGVRDLCVVVGSDDDPIRTHYASASPQRLRIRFAVQDSPLGSAHALLAAESEVGADPFLVINADNVYPASVVERVRALPGSGLAGFRLDALIRGGTPAERIAAYALLEVDADGFLVRIAEKPGVDAVRTSAGGALVSMTCWRFESSIFDACRAITSSPRGELELPDAVTLALARGVPFHVVPVAEHVLDLTSRQDVARVAEALRGWHVQL